MSGINEPPVWDLWTTFENPAIFRCNTANSSKNIFQRTASYLVATQFIQCNDLQRKNVSNEMKRVTISLQIYEFNCHLG